MSDNLFLLLVITPVVIGIVWFILALGDAEKCYWEKRKQSIEREDAACVAHGGFVFTDSDGRKCLFKPEPYAK